MTLNYYEMLEPWEPELVGVKDGSCQATVIEKGFKNKQHFKTFMEVFANPNHFNSNEAMTTEFELECVKLKKDAILTDFLSFAPMSYQLVSDRVYRILIKYNLGSHRFINARVEDAKGNCIEGYRFFYQEILDWDIIDFRRCEFKKGNKFEGYKTVVIGSKEEFLGDRFVKVDRLALSGVRKPADMFKVKLPIGILVSEALHKELAAIDVSGIKFRNAHVEINEGN